MSRLVIKAKARSDLQEIASFIARDNPERAVSYVEDLIGKMQVIGERPLTFPARDDLKPGLRGAVYGRYLILFRVTGDLVEILHVFHGSRDIGKLV